MIIPGRRRHGTRDAHFAAIGALALCTIIAAHAGDKTVLNSPPPETGPAATSSVPAWSFDVDTDYVLGSHFRHLEGLGAQADSFYEVEALRRFHIVDNVYFRVGVDVSRFDFSRSNAVFPYSLNALAGELALEYWHGDDIGALLKVSPGVYFARDHITENSFDFPIEAGTGIKITRTFSLAIGVTTGLLRAWPVLPVGGFVWDVNDQLKINAVLPEPRVSYQFFRGFQAFAGGELAGGGFRNGPTNDRRTNNAAFQYTELRGGGGIIYTPHKGIDFEASAGWVFQREIDFFHSGPDFKTRAGAPYFKLDLSVDLF
ncbi:MAG: hypothetical protein JO015_12495 [Verrucomicrobia bacterium]|nr:hypothetical protein [Verrucomicrobiota bacterium]